MERPRGTHVREKPRRCEGIGEGVKEAAEVPALQRAGRVVSARHARARLAGFRESRHDPCIREDLFVTRPAALLQSQPRGQRIGESQQIDQVHVRSGEITGPLAQAVAPARGTKR